MIHYRFTELNVYQALAWRSRAPLTGNVPTVMSGTVFFFFFSCLSSMCNTVGYDRLRRLYVQESSLAYAP